MKKFLIYAFLIVLIFPEVANSQALLLSPNRIVFEGKERKAKLTVNNPSDEEKTYRVRVLKKRMLENGKIVDVEEPLENEKFASRLIRYSPRTFTIPPKSTQIVRVSLRKPRDLEKGEYRSHMRVSVVPDAVPPQINETDNVNISIQVNYGITIPLIVRNGDLSHKVEIGDSKLAKKDDGKYHIHTSFKRQGDKSVYGDISIIHQSKRGQTILIKFLPGVAVYYPNNKRVFNIALGKPEGVNLDEGKLIIKYSERENEENLYSSKTIEL